MKKRIATILLLIAFAMVAVSVSPWSRSAEAQFPGFFGAQRFPALGVDKSDVLYLLMSVATAPASERRPHSQIFFAKSNDGGRNWNNFPQTKNLTKSPGEAFGPSVALTKSGTIRAYVVYHDNSNGATQSYLIKSKKKAKFKKPKNITPHNGGAFSPRVAVDSNESVFIVWGDTSEGGRKVVFVRSTDLGESFNDPLDIAKSPGEAFEPEIAVAPNDSIHVVWEDTKSGVSAIYASRSTDGGDTFSGPLKISGAGLAEQPYIATDAAGRVHITWMERVGESIQAFHSRSSDDGVSFSEPLNIVNDDVAEIAKPIIATFEDSVVYISYQDERRNNRQVFLVKSEDGGASFSDAERVSNADNDKGRAHSAAMAVDSKGVLHLVWIDASIVGNDEGIIFYRNTSDGRRFSQQREILALI
jgi:hypothetical protein